MLLSVNILIILVFIILQAFFSGSEMVILSSNRIKLQKNISKGSKGSGIALDMINNPRWFLATTSTGTNMCVIIASVVAAVFFNSVFKTYAGVVTIITVSPFLLMFGEIIPRTIARKKATELAPVIARPLWIASKIIYPVTFMVYVISRFFYWSVGKENLSFVTEKELELVLDSTGKASDLKIKEKEFILRVFHLVKSDVADVMVPLVNVSAISQDASVKDAVRMINRTGYSRLLVFQDRVDNLIGIVHAFDLIDINKDLKIKKIVRNVPFVSELQRAEELLISLQKNRNSIAVVVDEYGGCVGIITIEDILEEVVGEIMDEYDAEEGGIIRLDKNRFLINADIEIEFFNEKFKLNIPKYDYETIGGFLLKNMGRIPFQGESFNYNNLEFHIHRASKKSIKKVVVKIN